MNSRIEKQNIENVLFFDIETVSGSEELEIDSREYDLFEWKNRDRDTDEVLPQDELLELYKRKAALSSTHSKIVCISLGYVRDNKIYVMSITGNEYDVITEFLAIVAKSKGAILCGWNIIGFDLPTLRKRAFASGFKEWKIGKANDSGAKPWTLAEGVLDLMVEYKGTSYISESMDEVCFLLGIPSPKDKLSGSQVTNEFYTNGVKNIATYCEKDVVACIQILRKFQGEPLIEEIEYKQGIDLTPMGLVEAVMQDEGIGEDDLDKVKQVVEEKGLNKDIVEDILTAAASPKKAQLTNISLDE